MKYSLLCLRTVFAVGIVNYFALAAAPAQTSANSDTGPRALVQKARGSIVVMTAEDRTGQPLPPGLGFVIDRNLIATSHRLLPLGARLRANLAGQESPPINISYSDSYRRATVMTVSPAPLRADPLMLGDSDKVAANDRVFFFADPDPQSEILEAVVRRITTINDKRYFMLSMLFKPSIIGGPVFNVKGEVIGIISESLENPQVSLAVPASYLTVLLKARNPETPVGGSEQGSGVNITTGAGQGAGSGGGVGSGKPPGVGPGLPSTGPGAGPGNPEGGSSASVVRTRPKQINSVRPSYTEIARMNQTMGVVMIRIFINADGDVKRATVTKGLPDGLNEQAVGAALQLKFTPATVNGAAVNYQLSIQVEFNLR